MHATDGDGDVDGERRYDDALNVHMLDAVKRAMQSQFDSDAVDVSARQRRSSYESDTVLPFYLHTGLVEQCCRNVCSYRQMIRYCKKPGDVPPQMVE